MLLVVNPIGISVRPVLFSNFPISF